MPDHAVGLLDTSCVIAYPEDMTQLIERAVVSTITVAELSFGLYHADPMESASRELLYRDVLSQFIVVPYSLRAAHLYGAIAEKVRRSGRNPRSRRIDLMLASVALELGAVLVTRNPADFTGLEDDIEIVAV